MLSRGSDSPKLTSIQLIAVSNPLEASLGDVVKGDKVVVTGDTLDGADTKLVQTDIEVFSDINGADQLGSANINVTHFGKVGR